VNFLQVPAHPGCPGQNQKSRKTVVCVYPDTEVIKTAEEKKIKLEITKLLGNDHPD